MSHVYRVTVNRPVSVLVKAESKAEARAYVSKEISVSRLDSGDLLDAINNGEKVFPVVAEPAAVDEDQGQLPIPDPSV